MSSSQVCYDGARGAPWKLGFNQCRLSLYLFVRFPAHRTCGASPYIPSGLTASPKCYFPLCLSTLGYSGVLKSICSRLLAPSGLFAQRRSGAQFPTILVPDVGCSHAISMPDESTSSVRTAEHATRDRAASVSAAGAGAAILQSETSKHTYVHTWSLN